MTRSKVNATENTDDPVNLPSIETRTFCVSACRSERTSASKNLGNSMFSNFQGFYNWMHIKEILTEIYISLEEIVLLKHLIKHRVIWILSFRNYLSMYFDSFLLHLLVFCSSRTALNTREISLFVRDIRKYFSCEQICIFAFLRMYYCYIKVCVYASISIVVKLIIFSFVISKF